MVLSLSHAQLRALAAVREPTERKMEALENEIVRLQRDKSDVTTELTKAKAEVASCELQVRKLASLCCDVWPLHVGEPAVLCSVCAQLTGQVRRRRCRWW